MSEAAGVLAGTEGRAVKKSSEARVTGMAGATRADQTWPLRDCLLFFSFCLVITNSEMWILSAMQRCGL